MSGGSEGVPAAGQAVAVDGGFGAEARRWGVVSLWGSGRGSALSAHERAAAVGGILGTGRCRAGDGGCVR